LPGRPGARAEQALITKTRPGWWRRFGTELQSTTPPHEALVKLIAIERMAKAVVLIALALGLLVAGRSGYLTQIATEAQGDLNLDAGSGLIAQVIDRALLLIGKLPHVTLIAIGAIAYALLEGTEGVGLSMRKRWAEYLTVIATGLFIPFEVYEVFNQVTLFRVGALLLNLAVVGYLGWSKRLFVDV
jgi:uncharacterized membrane protein (DUF2068 family)